MTHPNKGIERKECCGLCKVEDNGVVFICANNKCECHPKAPDLKDYLNEQMKNPEFKKEWDKMDEEKDEDEIWFEKQIAQAKQERTEEIIEIIKKFQYARHNPDKDCECAVCSLTKIVIQILQNLPK